MSFILDALKKSELERQRQSVPGLIDGRLSPRRRPLPLWAIGLGVLLAVNLAALTFVLMRRGGAAPTAPVSSPAASTSTASAPDSSGRAAPAPAALQAEPSASATQHFSPLDAAPVYAPEIPVDTDGTENSAPSRAQSAPSVGQPRAAARSGSIQRSDPLLSDVEANTETQEILPSISEISLSGAQALPDLHLDVHVYATRPAERFVYINMRKYHEGSVLQEGPAVERIRRDGVVLNYQGLRFILPRQP
jgi:general secretion pathway protein B